MTRPYTPIPVQDTFAQELHHGCRQMTMWKGTKDGFWMFSTFSQLERVSQDLSEPSDPPLSKQTQFRYRTPMEGPG